MKIAKVVPLYKAGEKNLFTNYRPVSLLSQFSKILEKLFSKRLDKYIDKFSLLNDSQYGFRSGKSTALALMELTEEISSAMDEKMYNVGVFIDLKKAFDTIDDQLLIQKLQHFGIRGEPNMWLSSYLSDRSQFVNLDEINSDIYKVVCGVPQGSILRPKLFILYINDLCKVSNIVKSILFADDRNFYNSGFDLKELCVNINKELEKLNEWFALNKLSLNVSKTNFMRFGNRYSNVKIELCIGDKKIEEVFVFGSFDG